MTTKKKQHGFSLVEMIVYISILSIVSVALITASSSLMHTFAQLKAYEDIAQSSTVTLERITRELRRANAVDLGESTLSLHPGTLALTTTDLSGSPTSVTVNVSGDRVMIQQGAGASAPLSSANVRVTNLVFTRISNINTEGVLTEITMERSVRGRTVTRDFRTFTVLDGS